MSTDTTQGTLFKAPRLPRTCSGIWPRPNIQAGRILAVLKQGQGDPIPDNRYRGGYEHFGNDFPSSAGRICDLGNRGYTIGRRYNQAKRCEEYRLEGEPIDAPAISGSYIWKAIYEGRS
jgi:hypothetical protein